MGCFCAIPIRNEGKSGAEVEKLQSLWMAKAEMGANAGVKNHALRSGQTLLVPPQVEHSYCVGPDGNSQCMEIKFVLGRPVS